MDNGTAEHEPGQCTREGGQPAALCGSVFIFCLRAILFFCSDPCTISSLWQVASRIAWEHSAKDWQEIPKGGIYKGNIKKIWYNPAVRAAGQWLSLPCC